MTSHAINLYFFPRRDISDQACETSLGSDYVEEDDFSKCDQQVVNHWTKDLDFVAESYYIHRNERPGYVV